MCCYAYRVRDVVDQNGGSSCVRVIGIVSWGISFVSNYICTYIADSFARCYIKLITGQASLGFI